MNQRDRSELLPLASIDSFLCAYSAQPRDTSAPCTLQYPTVFKIFMMPFVAGKLFPRTSLNPSVQLNGVGETQHILVHVSQLPPSMGLENGPPRRFLT